MVLYIIHENPANFDLIFHNRNSGGMVKIWDIRRRIKSYKVIHGGAK